MAKANLTNTDDVVIRPGVESDCEVIMELIKDLAVYEGMLNQVKLTTEDLKRDAFHTSPPLVYAVVAELTSPTVTSSTASLSDAVSESQKQIVGYALFFKTYSAWNGKAIHLEDLFVRPECRYKGIGDKIFKYLAKLALEANYARISWECIDWNEPAMKFYRKYGAEDVTVKEHWHSYRFVTDTLKKLASE